MQPICGKSMDETIDSTVEQRIRQLNELLLNPRSNGNVDTLLDIFLGLVEECKLTKPPKGSLFANFLERCRCFLSPWKDGPNAWK